LANLYEILGNYKMAENMYLKLIEIYPNKKLYNLEIARFYKKIGEEEKFKYYYEKSKKLKGVTTEEGIIIEEIEKWIELQK
jgi:tetratricopeptide (TPR) repeat protein